MVRSEFATNNMKAWIHPACINSSGWWWWCYGVEDIFWVHFGPHSTKWASFKHRSPPAYCYWQHPSLYGHSVTIYYFQQDNARFIALQYPPVTRSQSNRSPLGWGRFAAAATAWHYHVNMDPNLWGMCPTWIPAFYQHCVPNKVADEGIYTSGIHSMLILIWTSVLFGKIQCQSSLANTKE